MTCIVAYEDDVSICLAGDSSAVGGWDRTFVDEPKVFFNGKFAIGFTTSFRMGQLLMDIEFPEQEAMMPTMKYLRTVFIDALRTAFKKGGYGGIDAKEGEKCGNFIVVYNSKIYVVDNDFQILSFAHKYQAVGSGTPAALGAFYAYEECRYSKKAENACEIALQAAERHNIGVAGPFHYLHIPKETTCSSSGEENKSS